MNNNPVVIRAAIIEDEIPAARLLNHMLAELRPEWEILLLPGNIEEAAEWFSENTHPDLLFLDIQLTDGNSFLLIEKACPKSMIVFTTAFDTYAVRAFTVNSIDYLLKPIHRERLAETLDKFDRLHTRYSVDGLPHQEEMLEVLRSLSNPITLSYSFSGFRRGTIGNIAGRRCGLFLFGEPGNICRNQTGKRTYC